jgi:uncharacterized membrane protein SirB2
MGVVFEVTCEFHTASKQKNLQTLTQITPHLFTLIVLSGIVEGSKA